MDYSKSKNYETIWIIGGEHVYKQFMENEIKIDEIIVTKIQKEYKCDKFFPLIDLNKYRLSKIEN